MGLLIVDVEERRVVLGSARQATLARQSRSPPGPRTRRSPVLTTDGGPEDVLTAVDRRHGGERQLALAAAQQSAEREGDQLAAGQSGVEK